MSMVGRGKLLDQRLWGIGTSSVSIPFAPKWLKSSVEKLSDKSKWAPKWDTKSRSERPEDAQCRRSVLPNRTSEVLQPIYQTVSGRRLLGTSPVKGVAQKAGAVAPWP